ncbi:MAG: hypothetical protein QM749_00460 [Aquabacterium sp.]
MEAVRPDLSPEEVDRICSGLVQNAAKVRYLRRLGLYVERRPDGSPLVARTEWERRFGIRQPSPLSQATPQASGAPGPRWRVAAA